VDDNKEKGRSYSVVDAQRGVALAGLADANEDGGQRQDGLQRAQCHQHGVDDDRPLAQRDRPEELHRITVLTCHQMKTYALPISVLTIDNVTITSRNQRG